MWSLYTLLLIFCWICSLVANKDANKYVCNTFSDYATVGYRKSKCSYNPDIGDDISNIIMRHGYTSRIYESVTEDGYILKVIRISTGKKPTRGVVFIQHPYAVGSVVWVDKGNQSLAFNLADLGYDVWLGNSRGTKVSSKHTSLTWHDANYWNYSFDEIAIHDFPVMLRLVKNVTNSSVVFIGYSAAGTSAFIFASVLKNVAKDCVKLFITISPALTLGKTFTILSPIFTKAAAVFGEAKFQNAFKFVLRLVLYQFPFLLPWFFYFLSGITSEGLYPPFIALLFHAMPDGANTKQADHYAQITISKKFQRYDYGEKQNRIVYKNEKPPEYPLEDITVPFHIIYGTRDTFFGSKDAAYLYEKLPPSVRYGKPYNIGNFSHMEFGYGKNVNKLNQYICNLLLTNYPT